MAFELKMTEQQAIDGLRSTYLLAPTVFLYLTKIIV